MQFILYLLIIIVAGVIAKCIFDRSKSSPPESASARLSRQTLSLEKLKEFILDRASEQCGAGIRKDELAVTRLDECAQRSLNELRATGKSEINLPFLTADQNGPKHFNISIDVSQIK